MMRKKLENLFDAMGKRQEKGDDTRLPMFFAKKNARDFSRAKTNFTIKNQNLGQIYNIL
jgi:hypothetical protein